MRDENEVLLADRLFFGAKIVNFVGMPRGKCLI